MPRAGAHKAIAYKALTLVEGIPASARRVGGALIDHYNLRTGRCDPGVDRLAGLLGTSEASVKRATKALAQAGLFAKRQHGGLSGSNAYRPVWTRFKEVVDDWDARMKATMVSKLTPSMSQNCDADGINSETQTLFNNQSEKTIQRPEQSRKRPSLTKKGTLEGAPSILLGDSPSYKSGTTAKFSDIAKDKAYKRCRDDFIRSGGTWRDLMEISDEALSSATDAELARHGTGVDVIHATLAKNRLEGSGTQAGVSRSNKSSPANETNVHATLGQDVTASIRRMS